MSHAHADTDRAAGFLLAVTRGEKPENVPHATTNLLELANRHGLIGLLASGDYGQIREAALPGHVRNLARQQVMVTHLRAILGRLAEASVDATVLKGPYLAHHAYQDPHIRPFTDIDLLVRPTEVDRALDVLRTHDGIRSVPPKRPKADKRDVPVTDRSGVRFMIDLHWDLFSYSQLHGCADGATEWSLNRSDLVEDPDLGPHLELPCEAHLAFLCTHALLDHRFRLILFRDLFETVRQGFDWNRLGEFSSRWELRSTTYLALRLANRVAGAPVPEGFLDDLKPSGPLIRALARALDRADVVHFDGHTPHLINLGMVLLHDDPLTQLRLVARAPFAFPEWQRRVGLKWKPDLGGLRRRRNP